MRANGIKALEIKNLEEEIKIELFPPEVKNIVSAPPPEEKFDTITAPVMGLVYITTPNRNKPFVSVGDKIKKGSVICVIEVMKVMNEITAAFDCEILDICFEDGTIVEYGQTLFKVRKVGAPNAG